MEYMISCSWDIMGNFDRCSMIWGVRSITIELFLEGI